MPTRPHQARRFWRETAGGPREKRARPIEGPLQEWTLMTSRPTIALARFAEPGGCRIERVETPELVTACRSKTVSAHSAATSASQDFQPDSRTQRPRRPPASSRKAGRRKTLGLLCEGLDSRRFVVFHIEHGVELGDLQQVVDLLGQVQEFQFTALVADGGEGAHQFADA